MHFIIIVDTDLHKAGDGLYGLVRFIEDIFPGVSRSCRSLAFGEEGRHIGHTPLSLTELSAKECSTSIVLEKGLQDRLLLFTIELTCT